MCCNGAGPDSTYVRQVQPPLHVEVVVRFAVQRRNICGGADDRLVGVRPALRVEDVARHGC